MAAAVFALLPVAASVFGRSALPQPGTARAICLPGTARAGFLIPVPHLPALRVNQLGLASLARPL